MGLRVKKLADLTEDEKQACVRYKSDSTMLHATCQGRSDEVNTHPDFPAFQARCKSEVQNLDNAVAKFESSSDGVLFSGHGRGQFAVGCLRGDVTRYIGFDYCYPGFVSTSSVRAVAEDFITKRNFKNSFPVLLEFRIKSNMAVLDFSSAGSDASEFEFLIGRHQIFTIINARYFDLDGAADQVLHLVLERRL